MRFLLDTNVVSEWTKARPDPGVRAWAEEADEDRLFLSVVTLAELRRGVARMSDGARRQRLEGWVRCDLLARFEGRVLPIDEAVADVGGEVLADREGRGDPIATLDAFIAVTALVHDLTLVTRNVRDFAPSLNAIVNPWLD